MARVCKVCGEEIEALDELAEWIIDVYSENKKKYSFHRDCLSEVTISGLN